MSDRTSARTEHGSRHRKHSESNKVLRTITFVLTPFLIFLIVCGIFVIALLKPFTTAKPYLDIIFAPEDASKKGSQVSLYDPNDTSVNIFEINEEIKDAETNEVITVKRDIIYPDYGDYYGSLSIGSIGLQDAPIYCGTSSPNLAKGVGWSNGSSYIGTVGNVVIAGHNNTYFALLSYCKKGDIVIIDTEFCKLTYVVKETTIFHKTNLTYVKPSKEDKLTLYTCWNSGMLGATPHRFGVICDLVSREWKEVKVSK